MTMSERLMTIKQVAYITTLSPSSIRRMVKAGTFPPPFRLPGTSIRIIWRSGDVQTWIDRVGADS